MDDTNVIMLDDINDEFNGSIPNTVNATHLSTDESEDIEESNRKMYRNDCPDILPASAASDRAHLIKLDLAASEDGHYSPTFPNAIVTTLWNHDPEALQAFLDENVKDFSFVRAGLSPNTGLVVQRSKDMVMVGSYEKIFTEIENFIEWESQVVYKIHFNGVWTPVASSSFRRTELYHNIMTDAVKRSQKYAKKGGRQKEEVVDEAETFVGYALAGDGEPNERQRWEYKCDKKIKKGRNADMLYDQK